MKDILSAIIRHRQERNWTEYELAEHSGLPQSTISSWYRKNMTPSLPSLEKVCLAFGISLSQLLADGEDPVSLTAQQKELLDRLSYLNPEQQSALLNLISGFENMK